MHSCVRGELAKEEVLDHVKGEYTRDDVIACVKGKYTEEMNWMSAEN